MPPRRVARRGVIDLECLISTYMNFTELKRSPNRVRASRATSVAPRPTTFVSRSSSAAGSNRLGEYMGLHRVRLTRVLGGSGRWCGLVDCLKLDGGEAAESGLAASAVIGAFDPGDDREPEFGARGPAFPVEHVFL